MKLFIALISVGVLIGDGLAADRPLAWPQFRGPNGSDKPEVVAKNPKLGERTAATPAIAKDVLFVRTDKHLYAFAEKM
jgi:hypothetical protein